MTENNNRFADQSTEIDEDILANVDQFIEGIYRDLSITPPHRSSMGNSTNLTRPLNRSDTSSSSSVTSPVGPTSLPITTPTRENTPARSPVARRNMDEEIDRINRICDTVDQNLRSIGLFINNSSSPNSLTESLANTNLTNSPSSSTSTITLNSTGPTLPAKVRKTRQQKRTSAETAVEAVIDLSNSQAETPPIYRQPASPYNDADDDVILVSANIRQVVDLCTPGSHQESYRPRHTIDYGQLNRRRLHLNSNVDNRDSNCGGSSSTIKCRKRSSLTPSQSNCLMVDETPSPNNNNGGRTPFMCPVCMESCLQRQPTSTICGHVFCKLCIEQTISLTHKCPMCNKKISKKQTFRIYL